MEGALVICPACSQPFECHSGNIKACGCYGIPLSDAAKTYIGRQYRGCLCVSCLQKIQQQFAETPAE